MSSDMELLHNYAQTRDAQAFSALVSAYGHMVYATCLRILRNVADAEDATQECFLRLARDSNKVHTSLGAWLHRCATNECISRVRQNASSSRRERTYEITRQAEKQPSAWGEVSEHVDRALEELPDELRQVLVGHFLERKPQTQLAAELGVSPATMSRRINEGVEAIRKKLARAGVIVPVVVLSVMLLERTVHAAPAGLMASLGKMAIAGPGANVGIGSVGGGGAGAGGTLGESGAAASAGAATGTSGTLLSAKVLLSLAGAALVLLVVGAVAFWNYARPRSEAGPAGLTPAETLAPGSAADIGAAQRAAATLSPEDRRVYELLYQLRLETPPDRPRRWISTVQQLASIGKPAVPALAAELEATRRDGEQRLLMLALRMIGDPRAVPALIHAIPRVSPASVAMEFPAPDEATRKFLAKRTLAGSHAARYGLSTLDAGITQCTAALEALTRHSEGHEPITHGARSDDPDEMRRDRQLREDFADRWGQWWKVHRAELVSERQLASLRSARIDLVDTVGLAKFGPVFPSGAAVTLSPVREATLEATGTWDAAAYIDFDSSMAGAPAIYTHNQGWHDVASIRNGDWITDAGVDAYARMTRPTDRAATASLCLLQTRGMTTWRIANERFDTIENEVHTSPLLDTGPWGATDDLVAHDAQTGAPHYNEWPVTFLFTTREGGKGIVQVVGPAADGHALRVRYRMFESDTVRPPPLAAGLRAPARPAQRLAYGPPVEITLGVPSAAADSALNLHTGQVRPQKIAPDDPMFTQAKREWLESWGGDLMTLTWTDGQICGLGADQLLAMEVSPRAWKALSPGELGEYLSRRDPESAGSIGTYLIPNAHHQTPATWIIQSRSGEIGLLQITDLAPDHLSLRYKLVHPEK